VRLEGQHCPTRPPPPPSHPPHLQHAIAFFGEQIGALVAEIADYRRFLVRLLEWRNILSNFSLKINVKNKYFYTKNRGFIIDHSK
jgi:hypothetical protein